MGNNYLHRKWVMRIILFILLLGAVGMTKAMAQTSTNTPASVPIRDTIKAKTVGIIPYSDDFITQEEVMERNYAITSFRMIDTTTVAVLTGASDLILVYSLNQNQILRKIQLPISARAFDYSDGVFYAVGDKTYLSVDMNGNILNKVDFKKPNLDFFLIKDLLIIDGQSYVHECNLNTYLITSNSLMEIDTSYFHYASGYKLRPNYNNGRGCNIVYQSPTRVNRTIGLSVDALGLEGKIACIHPISIDSNQIALNIQTGVEHPISFAKSYLVIVNLNGELISKVEVPINSISWISKPFLYFKNNWYYAFSGMEGVTFFKIDKYSNEVDSPDFNDMTEMDIPQSVAEPGVITRDLNNTAIAIGGFRTLTQAWENAEEYCDLEWTPIPDNVASSCTWVGGSGYIKTPITNTYYTEIGVPYSWGGFTDQRSFVNLASLGRYTGNIVTTSSTCGGNPYVAGGSDAYVIGVDCSGFVTRCWEHGSHVWTGAIPDISSYIATINASTYSNTSLFRTADALNWSSNNDCNYRHVMMYAYHDPYTGDINVFESLVSKEKFVSSL